MKNMQDENKESRSYLVSFFQNISFIARNARGVFILEILFFTISGLVPYLNVIAISLIISGAESLLDGTVFSQTSLSIGLILFSVSLFTQRMIMLGQMPLSSVFQYRIKNQIDCMIVKKTVSLPYANVEDPAFQTKLEGIRRFSHSLPNILFQTLSLFQAVLSLILLVTRFQGQAWLVLPLAVGQIPGLCVSLYNSRKQHELDIQQMSSRRKQDYYVKLSTNAQFVKEKALFRLGKLFSNRWNEQTVKLDEEQLGLIKCRIGLGMVSNIVAITTFSFCVMMILLSPNTDAARFISLTTALLSIQGAMGILISSLSNLRGQLLDNQMVFNFLESQAALSLPKERMDERIQTISFENVTFTYENCHQPALKNVSVELHSGETVAIVGENGAGKTTFIKLLLGLYQPDSGHILCNGRDVHTLDQSSYFQHISAILQDYNRYPLTVAQNIDLFAEEEDKPSDRIITVARQSGIDTFVKQLPSGYQTLLTNIREMGINLSGGQWQRLALARGMCKPADLFIMDEPTASLDPLLEDEILTQFLQREPFMSGDILKLIVSHRIGIAAKADRILVFRENSLEDIGTHEDLMCKNGYYANLYSTQAKWYQKGAEKNI